MEEASVMNPVQVLLVNLRKVINIGEVQSYWFISDHLKNHVQVSCFGQFTPELHFCAVHNPIKGQKVPVLPEGEGKMHLDMKYPWTVVVK